MRLSPIDENTRAFHSQLSPFLAEDSPRQGASKTFDTATAREELKISRAFGRTPSRKVYLASFC